MPWLYALGTLLCVGALFHYVIRFIPNNRVGIKELVWSAKGNLESGIIALKGEAGFQPEVMRGGVHLLFPTRDRVHVTSLVTVPQGQVGYIFARDGEPLVATQTLARAIDCNHFQDVRAFFANGGQRGPQRQILREGTYAINLAQFAVITADQIYYHQLRREDDELFSRMADQIHERDGFRPVVITADLVGIVTVHDGPSLAPGEIICPIVGTNSDKPEIYHNNFQDPEAYLRAHGKRGRQLQVLVEGTYYVNRLFATVETIPKTVVEVGYVGVVVSYVGDIGADLSGNLYRHGELVPENHRGVWKRPLMPGKYAFNTYAGKIILVPTTNFILKWVRREVGAHRYDENLSEVSLITKDAFEPSLPLSVVVHIDYMKAPLVVQRFGDVKKLVEQTLDPMVAAYFKNIGQTRTLIQLLQDRSSIQKLAADEMKEKFEHYDLELEEVLIGTPAPSDGDQRIEDILAQLRARQIAEEQIETYARQEKAAVKERELREAEARARQQTQITESELSIQVHQNQGKAELQRALQEADRIRALADAEASRHRALAEAEATKVKALGEAEADRELRVGQARAVAIHEQVQAYGGPQFQLTREVMVRFAEAIQQSGVDVVPRIMVGGSGQAGPGSAVEGLMALLMAERAEKVDAPKLESTFNGKAG
ncbi:MAG: SPFH domain-containing protein [Vulcanimicrobiota bacterium]